MLPDTLTPTVMEPEWSSQRRQLEAALRRIERIDVKRSLATHNGSRAYIVEVYAFETSKNRIPTNTGRPDRSEASCTTIARVERRRSAFSDLRCRVYNHVFEAHELTQCEFCQRVDEIVWGNNNPAGISFWMASEETRMRKLAKSVTALLEIAQRDCVESSQVCLGREKVHQALHSFLLTTD